MDPREQAGMDPREQTLFHEINEHSRVTEQKQLLVLAAYFALSGGVIGVSDLNVLSPDERSLGTVLMLLFLLLLGLGVWFLMQSYRDWKEMYMYRATLMAGQDYWLTWPHRRRWPASDQLLIGLLELSLAAIAGVAAIKVEALEAPFWLVVVFVLASAAMVAFLWLIRRRFSGRPRRIACLFRGDV